MDFDRCTKAGLVGVFIGAVAGAVAGGVLFLGIGAIPGLFIGGGAGGVIALFACVLTRPDAMAPTLSAVLSTASTTAKKGQPFTITIHLNVNNPSQFSCKLKAKIIVAGVTPTEYLYESSGSTSSTFSDAHRIEVVWPNESDGQLVVGEASLTYSRGINVVGAVPPGTPMTPIMVRVMPP